ncbi:CLDY protein, partial [Atractosteus spatula]|nr:CLDY protein [Atractosteus spatula]
MASVGMQVMGVTLALVGWIGVVIICCLPMWRVTAFIGNNIVTAQIFWEGIWMSCVVQSTGQMQCKVYDSMLALPTDLQAARALIVVAIVVGMIGIILAFVGGKCTNFVKKAEAKRKACIAAGAVFIATGVLCLIPVCWSANAIIRDFYNPLLTDTQRRELGASLYIGFGASVLLVLGGGLLCSTCPHKEEKAYSFKYSAPRSTTSAKSYV